MYISTLITGNNYGGYPSNEYSIKVSLDVDDPNFFNLYRIPNWEEELQKRLTKALVGKKSSTDIKNWDDDPIILKGEIFASLHIRCIIDNLEYFPRKKLEHIQSKETRVLIETIDDFADEYELIDENDRVCIDIEHPDSAPQTYSAINLNVKSARYLGEKLLSICDEGGRKAAQVDEDKGTVIEINSL